MNKKEKTKRLISQIFEPFAIGVLALLFIIPTLTVLNLTPITQTLENLNVLGVQTTSDISITLVEGSHEIFRGETLSKLEGGDYTYYTELAKRTADSYSKPILEIANNGTDIKTLKFYGQTEVSTDSNISIIVNTESFKIQDDRGNTSDQSIELYPGEKQIVFLSVESLSGVQFNEDFEMDIQVISE